MKKIAILGSTGSIGQSTLSICESFPERYQPVALAAGRNLDVAFAQCLRWRPRVVSLATEELAAALEAAGCRETARRGIVYDLPRRDWRLSSDVSVNYFVAAKKLQAPL